ncbi:MAG TPA: hypothetical protein VKH35_01340 [Thermoanaerobaculia bacterium]|nr:hypothetical protein [Thermoanaerobaculia bacterium]
MKRITILLALVLTATLALAQEEKKPEDTVTTREFKTKIFEIHNRSSRDIYAAIRMLGSGFKGSAYDYNQEMHTITVRDFPENITTVEQAIQRLDRPAPAPSSIEMKISVLIGSKTPLPGAAIPDDLAPVVKQLQSTLRYSHYGLLTANVHRTRAGDGIQGSGIAEPALLGMTAQSDRPILYTYRLHHIDVVPVAERQDVSIENFDFGMRFPINTGKEVTYQSVGFQTPVNVRPNEKVVIGTTTMGDKALIVVVTANVEP